MRPDPGSFGLPRPGKALLGVMIAIAALWVALAVSINWVGVGAAVAQALSGSTQGVLHGQVWRLLTAALIHEPREPGHLLMTVLGLYFFGTSLEDRWGQRRLLVFLFGSAAFAFALQVAIGALVPPLNQSIWFGGLGMTEAVLVAWALANRNSTVRMFFLIPISGTALLVFVLVLSVLNVLALRAPSEGLVTPFGGMLAGWLFGDGSPLRRLYLKMRLKQIQAETTALRAQSAARARRAPGPSLRVVEGGGGRSTPPKDKRYLN